MGSLLFIFAMICMLQNCSNFCSRPAWIEYLEYRQLNFGYMQEGRANSLLDDENALYSQKLAMSKDKPVKMVSGPARLHSCGKSGVGFSMKGSKSEVLIILITAIDKILSLQMSRSCHINRANWRHKRKGYGRKSHPKLVNFCSRDSFGKGAQELGHKNLE